MTDGPGLLPHRIESIELPIDLTNYASWIELQHVMTIAGILDLAANELYRRGLFAAGNEIKHVVSELRA